MIKPVVFKLTVTLLLTIISFGSNQVSTSEFNINKTRIKPFINNLRIEDSTPFQQSFNPYAVEKNPKRAGKVRSKRDTGQCGQAEDISSGKPLGFGGAEILRGSWPWIVAIYKGGRGFTEFKCGGTLIYKKAILTAAHCFVAQSRYLSENEILVYVGRHDIEDLFEEDNKLVRVEKIVPHPEYSSSTDSFDADIAIIILRDEIQYTKYIRPACLWSCDSSVVDEEGSVVGWGRNGRSTFERLSSTPRRVKGRIVSDGVCLRSNAVYQAITSERTICAGNRDGTGPCAGDSGAGMMIKKNGKWFLRGIVSASLAHPVDFCNLKEYVVYGDVAKFLPWISEVTGQPLSNFIRLQGHKVLSQCNHAQPDPENCFCDVPYPVRTTYICIEDLGMRKKGDILFGTTNGVYIRKVGELMVTKVNGIDDEILIIQRYPDYGSVHVITLDGKIYFLKENNEVMYQNDVPYPVKAMYTFSEEQGNRKRGDVLFGTTNGVYIRKALELMVTKVNGIDDEILIIQRYPDYGSVHVITLDGKIYFLKENNEVMYQNDVPYPVKAMYTFSEEQGNRKKGDVLFGTTNGVYIRKALELMVTKVNGIDEEILIIQPYPDRIGGVHVITLDGKIYYLKENNEVVNQNDVPYPITAMYTFNEDDRNYKKGDILFKTTNGIYIRKVGESSTKTNQSEYFNVKNRCYK